MPDEWQSVRRVLAVRLDNIGDVVLLGPALRTIKQQLPDASLTLLASPAGTQVVPLLPWVDDVITRRVPWQEIESAGVPDVERERELVEVLRERHFDAALIFTSFSQSPYPPAYVCYLAGIPIRLGQSKEFGGNVLSQWVKPRPDDLHQAERNLHLLEQAGFDVWDRHLELHVPDDAQEAADRMLGRAGINPFSPFILLAPGASCEARRYDPYRYAVVASGLAAETQLPIVVVGSEREHELCQPILSNHAVKQVVSLVGQTSIPELAGIIRRTVLVIANDSGPMHLADAFARPMVILYSGTEYESQWRPRKAPTVLLRRSTACSPCYAFHCPYDMECLDIPPEEVIDIAVAQLVERTMSEERV
ncbi:MAG: glycosyltransferase family 9 protein [Chloroflexota bacterium]|nr:glycosyltransferase family 9 protein [Chloroflexota bacterium]